VIVPDVNVLIYAADASSRHHEAARMWWEDALSGDVVVGVPWIVATGVMRILANERIVAAPYSPAEVLDIVDGWYERSIVVAISPGARHREILRGYIEQLGRGANAIPDAHLAALATEHGATLYSTDRGFARYEGLRWADPLAARSLEPGVRPTSPTDP
jgi:toxin-antitoxin system PIN domain toxin